MRVEPEAGGRGDGGAAAAKPTISAVLCYNSVIATGAWFGLMRAGRQSGEAGVESYFEQRIALAAFAELPEDALDDLPLTWVTTPARAGAKAWRSAFYAEWKRDRAARNQIISPRLITRK